MIWKRYFVREFLKIFFLFIGAFYVLYILIDYSAHAKVFHQTHIHFADILTYYLCHFTKQADLLIPIALLIANVKLLTTLNMQNEITALVTGGISFKKLMGPSLCIATVFASLLYWNFESLQPRSLTALQLFETRFFKEHVSQRNPVQSLILADTSLLIYRFFDPKEQEFSDVYWIKNLDHLVKIQNLSIKERIPIGYWVTELNRSSEGEISSQALFPKQVFTEMPLDKKLVVREAHLSQTQSLSQLFSNISWKKMHYGLKKMSDREAEILSLFFYKLLIPLTVFIAILAPAPFCLRFGRTLSIFRIYAFSLFGFITLFTLVHTCVILSTGQVVPPLWALVIPSTILLALPGYQYAKL